LQNKTLHQLKKKPSFLVNKDEIDFPHKKRGSWGEKKKKNLKSSIKNLLQFICQFTNLLMRVAPGICGGWVIINYAVEDDDPTIS
jgi:hypothetical protein